MLLNIAHSFASDWVHLLGEVEVNNKGCYLISNGFSGVDVTKIDTFCGVINNNTMWWVYSFLADSYDLQADTLSPLNLAGGEWMSVSDRIKIDDKCCYIVKKDISLFLDRSCRWDTFCGRFKDFEYEDGHLFRLYVDNYNLQSDTIAVQQIRVGEFVKIAPFRGIVDGKRCYLTKRSGKNVKEWNLFCGELFMSYPLQKDVETQVLVKKYDINADTIKVLRAITADDSPIYRRDQIMKARINNSDYIHVRVDGKLYYWVEKDKLSPDVNDLKINRKMKSSKMKSSK